MSGSDDDDDDEEAAEDSAEDSSNGEQGRNLAIFPMMFESSCKLI